MINKYLKFRQSKGILNSGLPSLCPLIEDSMALWSVTKWEGKEMEDLKSHLVLEQLSVKQNTFSGICYLRTLK